MASHGAAAAPPHLERSASVAYMESRVLPAVRAVHAPAYLEKLRATCEDLAAAQKRQKRRHGGGLVPTRNLSGLFGDTFASRNSLSAALCAVFAACRAVDEVVVGSASNAFAVILPLNATYTRTSPCLAAPSTFAVFIPKS